MPASKHHLLHIFSTFNVGGAQMRFSQIANALSAKYRHTIIAMDGQTDAQALLGPDVNFIMLPLMGDTKVLAGKTHQELPLHQRLQLYRGTLEQSRPDKFITYNWGSIEWGLANLVPICEHIHIEDGFGPEEAKRRLRRRNWIRRLTLSNHTDVIVPSRTLETIAKTEWRLPTEHLSYIPNGIDCSRFDHGPDAALLQRLSLPSDRPIIGTIAALRREKNIPRLITAFEKTITATPCHLLIVGSGPEKAVLEEHVQSAGLGTHVTFAGYIREPETIMGAMDLFAISSDTEQMPYSVLEAMAAGLPVIGTDVGDIKTMVAKENQAYISKTDEAFQNALQNMITNPTLAARIGKANADKVRKEYQLKAMIAQYDELFSL